MARFSIIILVAVAAHEILCNPVQIPLQAMDTSLKPSKLHGRFLHITDMHPDPHYTVHSSQKTACHRKKPKKKKDRAGYYGTPYSDCDSPLRLTNYTLDYLDENWASEIDFVIWTGDNARHDNDRKIPRTPTEIYELNRAVANRMDYVFLRKGIPVVPSLGNNDVWPHNILEPGPNKITNEFASIWSSFIPFPYLQVFQRGAYYSVEVIPNELAVVSLNTMYFYDSNKAISGCPYLDRDDPGNLQFDWLEVQLKMYRERGMQVWLSGHVPPSPGNYFPECYVRYVDLALRFQDTILGHLYGHMNVDHFFFLEAVDLQIISDNDPSSEDHDGLFETLLEEFSALPNSKDMILDEYAVINVAPSVVPNPYVPSFRVFAYNTSNAVGNPLGGKGSKRKHGHRRGDRGNKAEQCKSEKHRNTWKCHLEEPWYSDPGSPSRSNQRWTPLGFAQYNIPALQEGNKTHMPEFALEYATFSVKALQGANTKDAKGKRFYPIPLQQLPEALREGSAEKSKYAPYKMEDLTIGSWVKLARGLGNKERKKLRRRFREYMFAGSEVE
ncbi:Metallo-dependent phosphatase-like protein [Cyathus striatus]|nr:Metallo-dependent phosphatase-like protein [Cyathus striatus]